MNSLEFLHSILSEKIKILKQKLPQSLHRLLFNTLQIAVFYGRAIEKKRKNRNT